MLYYECRRKRTVNQKDIKSIENRVRSAFNQGYDMGLKDNTNYKLIFNRLYNWLNDMRLAIAPDETVTDEDERHDRLLQIDLIDELMEWMIEQEEKQ